MSEKKKEIKESEEEYAVRRLDEGISKAFEEMAEGIASAFRKFGKELRNELEREKSKTIQKKLAFLDFDGTLSKGYISIDFMHWLREQGFYSGSLYREQMKILNQYKRGELSYDDWCRLWGDLWTEGFKGKTVGEVSLRAIEFFIEFRHNIYPTSYDLIRLLKSKGYSPIIISAGSYEVVRLAAKDLGVDKIYTTEAEIVEGIYTGKLKTDLHTPMGKAKVLKKIAEKYPLKGSLAFGDALSDKCVLELVEIPIALNPSENLKNTAKENGWTILNHENVVEEIKKIVQYP